MKRFATIISTILLLASCISPMHRSIEKLHVGMEKSEVLELVGSPNKSGYKDELHEWIYIYYIDDQRKAKKVIFKKNIVTSVKDHRLEGDMKDLVERSDSLEEMEKQVEKRRREDASKFKDLND